MHYQKHVFVCANIKANNKKCCGQTATDDLVTHMKERLLALDAHGVGKIRVSRSGCLGRCALGPCVVIYPEGLWYTYENMDDIDEIISSYLLGGEVVKRLLIESEEANV